MYRPGTPWQVWQSMTRPMMRMCFSVVLGVVVSLSYYQPAIWLSVNFSPLWQILRGVVNVIESLLITDYFPEKLFARLNGFIPRFVDGGLRKQNRLMERFARG